MSNSNKCSGQSRYQARTQKTTSAKSRARIRSPYLIAAYSEWAMLREVGFYQRHDHWKPVRSRDEWLQDFQPTRK